MLFSYLLLSEFRKTYYQLTPLYMIALLREIPEGLVFS